MCLLVYRRPPGLKQIRRAEAAAARCECHGRRLDVRVVDSVLRLELGVWLHLIPDLSIVGGQSLCKPQDMRLDLFLPLSLYLFLYTYVYIFV